MPLILAIRWQRQADLRGSAYGIPGQAGLRSKTLFQNKGALGWGWSGVVGWGFEWGLSGIWRVEWGG